MAKGQHRHVFAVPAADAPVTEKKVLLGSPVQLSPIPWGKPDPVLGRVLCQHLEDANPPTVITFNPITDARMRTTLRHLHIHTA